jgi:hypothetical protein
LYRNKGQRREGEKRGTKEKSKGRKGTMVEDNKKKIVVPSNGLLLW